MKRFLKIILFLIGFPALLGFVVWKSLTVLQEGSTYGFWPYVGIILAGVFALVYLIAFIITGVKAKKNAGNRKKVLGGVVALVIVSFVMTAGLWLVIDIPKLLPDILNGATSGTIGFDDLREDYDAHAEVHSNLLDEFIKMNYNNGNLDDGKSLDYWLEVGYSSPKVQELIATNFASMDKNGYVTFKGPWINLADGGRLTIPVLVHLVINEREFQDLPYILAYEVIPNPYKTDDHPNDMKNPVEYTDEALIKWSILDMQGTPMVVDLGGLFSADVKDAVFSILNMIDYDKLSSIFTTLNECIEDDALAGTPIYIGLDTRNGDFKLEIASTVEGRGMWDYKKSAWLNSNHLLFAVISVFPARQWLYIWGGIVIFSSVAVGALRLKEFGGDDEEEEKESEDKKYDTYDEPKIDYSELDKEVTKGMSPYERAFYLATQERNRR